jgi:Histone acetyltransferase
MRVQREITMDEIVDGPKMGNLRQKVHQRVRKTKEHPVNVLDVEKQD